MDLVHDVLVFFHFIGLAALYRRTPMRDLPELEAAAPFYQDWLGRPCEDAYWRALAAGPRRGQIAVPSLNIGGWYDPFLAGTLAIYQGMRDQGGSPEARAAPESLQRALHGPAEGEDEQRERERQRVQALQRRPRERDLLH